MAYGNVEILGAWTALHDEAEKPVDCTRHSRTALQSPSCLQIVCVADCPDVGFLFCFIEFFFSTSFFFLLLDTSDKGLEARVAYLALQKTIYKYI